MSAQTTSPVRPPPARPPAARLRALGWVRANLLATPLSAAVTLLCLWLLWQTVPGLLGWAVIDARWTGTTRDACQGATGACWVFVRAWFDQFVYGFYPVDQRWRVDVAGIAFALLAVPLLWPGFPRKRAVGVVAAVVFPPACIVLLLGGWFGLPVVETRLWGGMMLTAFMAVYAGLIAVPLGIMLALGRQGRLPLIRTVSVILIEFWRGVPILTVIFLASFILPLIVPAGVTVDQLARAVIALGLVIAAYMAEVVRGGLQTLPPGQAEAARALGLNYWKSTLLVVLPQALRVSIPGLVNEFIALIKNTSLVLIISLFDLLGVAHRAKSDPQWAGQGLEAYVFAGGVFWLVCFALSRYSLGLERRLGVGKR